MTTASSTAPNPGARGPAGQRQAPGTAAARARGLLACGVVAAPLFVIAVLAQAATRPGFSLARDAASLLDDGPWGGCRRPTSWSPGCCWPRPQPGCGAPSPSAVAAGGRRGCSLFLGVSIAFLWAAVIAARLRRAAGPGRPQ